MSDVFKASKFQIAFFNEITDTDNNIILKAVAGSGKTTSIIKSLDLIPRDEPTIFLAFNRDIVAVMKERIKYPNVYVSTLHGFGMKMLITHFGGLKVDENKSYIAALKNFVRYAGSTKENKSTYAYRVSRLVNMARMTMVDVTNEEAMLEMAIRFDIDILENEIQGAAMTLEDCNKQAHERIDFEDMIYQPVLKNLKLRKFKWVFVDEAQDLNVVQQMMIKRIINPNGGRMICVGDPMQSIYGFAGADSKSFERMSTMLPNTVELPLSICYRCPPEVVKQAQTIVPYIMPNPHRPPNELANRAGSFKEMKGDDWVLCRNTKPLVMLFIMLISEGKNAFIKGREIGANLINLIKRTKAVNIEELIEKLNQDRVNLKVKLIKKRVYRPDMCQQMVEFDEKFRVVKILSRYSGGTVKKLIDSIKEIFLDEKGGAITLSTIHRAKGSEADRVFIVAPELIPSKYAKTADDFAQEENLRYVMITRAKKELIWVNDFNVEEFDKFIKEMAL